VRPLLTESTLLDVFGGGLGVAFAYLARVRCDLTRIRRRRNRPGDVRSAAVGRGETSGIHTLAGSTPRQDSARFENRPCYPEADDGLQMRVDSTGPRSWDQRHANDRHGTVRDARAFFD
jgi:hypothetical protein